MKEKSERVINVWNETRTSLWLLLHFISRSNFRATGDKSADPSSDKSTDPSSLKDKEPNVERAVKKVNVGFVRQQTEGLVRLAAAHTSPARRTKYSIGNIARSLD